MTNSVSGACEGAGNESTTESTTETDNGGIAGTAAETTAADGGTTQSVSTPAPTSASENDPVFVDSSGRRPRWVRRVGWGMGGICVTYCLALGLSLAGAAPFAPETLMPIRDPDREASIGAADGRDQGAPESSRSRRNDSAGSEAVDPSTGRPSPTPTPEGAAEEPADGNNPAPDRPAPDRPTTAAPPAAAPPAGNENPGAPDENDPGEGTRDPTDPTPSDPTPTDPAPEPSSPSGSGGSGGGGGSTGGGGSGNGGSLGDVVDDVVDPVTDAVGGLLGGVLG